MIVKVEIDVDTETCDYSMVFKNGDGTGESIDYTWLMEFLKRAFGDVEAQAEAQMDGGSRA